MQRCIMQQNKVITVSVNITETKNIALRSEYISLTRA